MHQLGSETKQGYSEWLVITGVAYLLFGLLVGPFVFLLLSIAQRRQWTVLNHPLLLLAATGWLLVYSLLSTEYGFYLGHPLLGWTALIPAAPLLDKLYWLILALSNFLKPKTMQEQLEEQQRQAIRQEQSQSYQARKITEIPAQRQKLRLGRLIDGDDLYPKGFYNLRNWLVFDEGILDQHLFILGATGAGKSETLKRLIHEILVGTDRDIYLVDGKGDEGLAQEIRGLAQQHGRGAAPVFRMGHGRVGAVYNGFRGQPADIYSRLVALIGLEEMEGAATYYADINRDLLQLICYAPAGAPRSFEEVAQRLNKEWLLAQYRHHPHEQQTIEKYDERALEGLAVRLRPLLREFSPSVGAEGFALEETHCAIFSLRTQSVGDTARRFLGFLIEDIKDFCGKRQQRPAVLIIDEYAQFPAAAVLALLSLARSSKLGVILATQDVSTLGGTENRQQILANTNTQLLMRSNFPEEIAKMAGTKYQVEGSVQHEEGVATGMGSVRVQHTHKIEMNKVPRMGPGECYVIKNRYVYRLQVDMVTDIPSVPEQPEEKRHIQLQRPHTVTTTIDQTFAEKVPKKIPTLETLGQKRRSATAVNGRFREP